jgi:hypothetical protein
LRTTPAMRHLVAAVNYLHFTANSEGLQLLSSTNFRQKVFSEMGLLMINFVGNSGYI